MTLRYLNKQASGLLVNGVGQISMTPDTGQYWIPRVVRIGTTYSPSGAPTSQPFLICKLYHGGVGDVNVDAYVDGTGNGLGDVTTLLNGSLIQTGEYITAAWQNLDLVGQTFAGVTGYLQLLGLTTDSITEATDALATAAPGPGFVSPIPNPLQMPPAAQDTGLFIFQNPGPNNAVVLLNPAVPYSLYIYSVTTLVSATVPNLSGYLQPVNSTITQNFAFYDAATASLNTEVVWDFHGMRTYPGGLQWFQNGTAAAGSATVVVGTSHRFLPF